MISELIDNCMSELDENRPYLNLSLPMFLWFLWHNFGDEQGTDGIVTVVEQTLGLVLFLFVVVPLRLIGKVIRR